MQRRRFVRPVLALVSLSVLAAGTLAACGAPSSSAVSDGKIAVVTSTNVYGNIVSAIGGDKVSVTALINQPSQDPHSFQPSAQDKLTVSKAALGVENGGGYDDFFDQLSSGGTLASSKIINVVDLSGLAAEASSATFNEHVWYDFPAMTKLADTLATRLGALDPADAGTFTKNAKTFNASLARLTTRLDTLKKADAGDGVAITEPVPLYMLQAAGLVNKTPAKFSEAIEEGTDVPAIVLQDTLNLMTPKSVKFLAYNSQTEGPQTVMMKNAANASGLPVVEFTETLPAGQDYLQWMGTNVTSVEQALAK